RRATTTAHWFGGPPSPSTASTTSSSRSSPNSVSRGVGSQRASRLRSSISPRAGPCSGTWPCSVTSPAIQSRWGSSMPLPMESRPMGPAELSAPADAARHTVSSTGTTTRSEPTAGEATRRARSSSITTRMVLLVVVLVGCTTVAMGTLAYRRARRALEAAANARLEVLARDIARDLHRELAERVADITTWARLEGMVALTFGDVDKQLAEFLRQTREGRDVYLSIVAFDREGRDVAGAHDADDTGLALVASSSPELRVVPRDGGASAALALATPVVNPRRPGERIGTVGAPVAPGTLAP